MDAKRFEQIEKLYNAAITCQSEERSALLDQANPEVRREVELLLAQKDSLLDHPAWEGVPKSTVSEAIPRRLIERYEIEGKLGEGGMGVVYRALDTTLNRPVAIKFLSDDLADAAARHRFQREAQTASSLNHPHILTVYDAGEFDGRQYLVTEFVDGGTLKTWVRSAKRTWRQIIELLAGPADGLAVAHAAGILHRDIKPDNVLVSQSGYAKLADFGLAKLAEGADADLSRTFTEGRTRPGIIIGTIPYMSPEQASGKPVDARSDIFSFGVLLYEMLGGRRPFTGNTDLQVLQAIQHSPAEPLGDDVPLLLRSAVEKALEKDPAERYQSMRDLVVDLKRATRQTVSEAAPLPTGSSKPSSRPRKWIAIGAAALVAIGGIAWAILRPKPPDTPRLEYTQLTKFADSAVAPTLSPDGRMLAFIRGTSTFEGPGDVYVKLLPNGDPVQLTHDSASGKEGPVAFSPDGSRIAFTNSYSGGGTWTASVLGGEPTLLVARASGLSWVEPVRGQRRVMFSSIPGEGIHMGIFESTESRSELRTVYMPAGPNGMAHRSFLSPDHRSVLVVEMDLGSWLPCRLVPFDGSSAGTRVGPQPAQCTDAAWSPDGKWMYMSANTGDGYHIWRQRFPDGMPERVTSGATEEQGLSFDPDGRSFVTSVGASQSTLWVHDAKGDRQITSEGFAFLPSFSGDGKTLYYLVRSRASRRFVSGELWSASLETGRATRLLPDYLTEHYNVSADGKRVVFLSVDDAGHSQLWLAPLDASSPPRRLASTEYADRALFDPHGGVLFAGGEGGVYYLYHVNDDGTGLQKLLSGTVSFLYAISPDGKAVAVWVGADVYIEAYDGSSQTLICKGCGTAGEENRGLTPALLSWSSDQKFLYVHASGARQTYAVPLRPGQLVPALPTDGFVSLSAKDVEKLPGAKALPEPLAFGGADPSIYAYPRVTTHRNIYRIPVP
ncbi:MAG: protein kinase [Candidatus Solibacter sp.]|jgi:serine/threonine protein kinase/sugar lactone lactonase YvrE